MRNEHAKVSGDQADPELVPGKDDAKNIKVIADISAIREEAKNSTAESSGSQDGKPDLDGDDCQPSNLPLPLRSHQTARIQPLTGNASSRIDESQPLLEKELPPSCFTSFSSVIRPCAGRAAGLILKTAHVIPKDLSEHRPFNANVQVKHFTEGAIFVSNKIWAPAFWLMFLHDHIVFAAYPLDRYDTTLGQLWLGTATNHITLTSNFSNDLAGTVSYSLVPTLVSVAIPAAGFIWMIPPFRNYMQNSISPKMNVLGELYPRGLKGLYFKNIYHNYIAWKTGLENERPSSGIKLVRNIFFWPFVFGVFYANFRLFLLDLFKVTGLDNYRSALGVCTGLGKLYILLKDFGNYECVVVDWDFIKDRFKFTNQDALNALFKYSQDPEFILPKLDELFRSKPYFQILDASELDWKQWQPSQWKAFLEKISNHTNQLEKMSLGAPVPTNFFPAEHFMDDLLSFLRRVKTRDLIMPNQGMGDTQFQKLKPVIPELSSLVVSDDQLKSINGLANNTKELKSLTGGGNPFGNFGVEIISSEIAKPESVLEEVVIPKVGMDEEGLETLENALPSGKVRKIVLEDDLSQADFAKFGESVAKGGVQEIGLPRSGMDSSQAVLFVSNAKGGNLTSGNFAGNYIKNEGAIGIVIASQGGELEYVNLDHNSDIDDTGAIGMASELNKTNINELSFVGTQITAVGVKALIEVPNLKAINISDRPIGDAVASVLVETPTNVENINLARTGMTPKGGRDLAKALSINMRSLKILDLSENNLPDEVLAEVIFALDNSQVEKLILKGNIIGPKTINALKAVLPRIPLKSLNIRNTQLINGVKIARALITETPHSEQIGNSNIDIDEIRAIRKARSATTLEEIDISMNPYDDATEVAFDQVLPSTNVKIFRGNSNNSSRIFFTENTAPGVKLFRAAPLRATGALSNVSGRLTGSQTSNNFSGLILGAMAGGPIILGLVITICLIYILLRKKEEDTLCETSPHTPTL